MTQSVEERRQSHIRACHRYRLKNLERMRASARERMRRLRADRKGETRTTPTATPQNLYLTTEALTAAVKAALAAFNEGGSELADYFRTAQRQTNMVDLPPSSEPDYSDSCSETSDPQFLPEVTCSSDEENSDSHFDDYTETWSSDDEQFWETSSSDDEREVAIMLLAWAD
ncbi:hypothetical protein H0H92_005715 [Tricholoma furcatifolium]|nr:hypothetical protein H0H92_005715 [Tricholoma furcatifolium]